MKLKSIETRDELGLMAFGARSRVFEVGISPTAEITLDLANRIVWLRAIAQDVPHGIPLEQVRRFTPVEIPDQPSPDQTQKAPAKAPQATKGKTQEPPKPAKA